MTIAQHIPPRDDAGIDGPLTGEVRQVERTMPGHAYGRDRMREWLKRSQENAYTRNRDFQHTVRYHLGETFEKVDE
jgi:hypothetical protein